MCALIPAAASAQQQTGVNPKEATYITAEEVQTVNKQSGVDRTIRVMDVGSENFAVGVIHRGPSGGARGAAARGGAQAAAGGAARGAANAGEPCGEQGASIPAGAATGLYHESQTEGYLIISGAGTMVTGGRVANGRKSGATDQVTTTLNGPSCSGVIIGSDVMVKDVKEGDIIIIPAGVPHGWTTIPDHVDYLSFRPSARVLTPGYIHPSIKK
jgi:mannose-6-phosphate isomerase-like protein (cupin superfamily)